MSQGSYKKIISCTLIVAIMFAYVARPTPASATGLPVFDSATAGLMAALTSQQVVSTETDIENKVKEWGLDTVAYSIAGALTTKLTNSVVNWANGGFNGAPSFIQDFSTYFKNQDQQLMNTALGQLNSMSGNNPFVRDLSRQLINSAQTGSTGGFDLTKGLQFDLNRVIGPNYKSFYTNPANGGWAGWNAISSGGNNPIGSLIYVSNQLNQKAGQNQQNATNEAISGGGFMNIKTCVKRGGPSTRTVPDFQINQQTNQIEITGSHEVEIPENERDCTAYETKTPGATIKSSLDKALGVPQERLTAADEFKEVLSASLTTLITGLTNAGLKKLVSSFSQPAIGSVGGASALDNLNSSNGYNWLNLPGQVVDIDEVQQIVLPDGSYAINTRVPNPPPSVTNQAVIDAQLIDGISRQ